MAEITKDQIEAIVSQVVRSIRSDKNQNQKKISSIPIESVVFSTTDQAISAAKKSQSELVKLDLIKRKEIISEIRRVGRENAVSLAELAVEDTGMGVADHKRQKNEGAADLSPGVEDLISETITGNDGVLLIEYVPFGVINSITPTTNPTSTVINHAIIMISAGNSIVFSPHPNATKSTIETMCVINDAIVSVGGPANLLTAVENATLRTVKEIMNHPDVAMVVATGGKSVVRAAMESGKKAIAAGPGNPPAIIDETADLQNAARSVVDGASFDNNLLCIGEKSVFVVDSVYDRVRSEIEKNGGYILKSDEIPKIEKLLDGENEKNYIGKDAKIILKNAGISADPKTVVIVAEVNADHVFVMEEFLMPILPIVRVRDFDEALRGAISAEGGRQHTAIIHTRDLSRITKFAQAIDGNVTVVNAPSFAGAGIGGEGFLAMTIAGPTGEGFTRPRTFTKQRRISIAKDLSHHTI